MRGQATLALCVLLAAGIPTSDAQPQAYGVTPTSHDLADAQAGQTYLRTVQVQNQLDSASTIEVVFQGTAGSWTAADPPSGFTIPARSNQVVELSIHVPSGTGPGQRTGQVTFITEPKSTGQGSSVRLSAGVALNVTVGGIANPSLLWHSARTPDTDTLSPPVGFANATNTGNVAMIARMAATVTPLDGDEVLASGLGSRSLDPGESAEVEVSFADRLPAGQYRMRFAAESPPGFQADVPFKVTQPGESPPSGTLRGLLHAAYSPPNAPVRIDGLFENTGQVPIRSAQLKGEVRDAQGNLLATLESDALAVSPGQALNLTAYWTPPQDGTFHIVGHVVYDGYLTTESSSILNVDAAKAPEGPAGGIALSPWWLLALLALATAVFFGWLLGRRRKDRKGKPPDQPRQPPRQPPPRPPGQPPSRTPPRPPAHASGDRGLAWALRRKP